MISKQKVMREMVTKITQKPFAVLGGVLLAIALMIGFLPQLAEPAYAWEGDPYSSLVNTTTTVEFNGIDWYVIADDSTAADAGTVTLFAKEILDYNVFGTNNVYSDSRVKKNLDKLITYEVSFVDVADAIETIPSLTTNKYNSTETYDTADNVRLYLLSVEEATALPMDIRKSSREKYNMYWLRSPGNGDKWAAIVDGNNGSITSGGTQVENAWGVRPALKLKLSSVYFSSDTNTFTLKPYLSYIPKESDSAEALAAKVVKFNGYDWYIIADDSTAAKAGTVTLLAADTSFGLSKFHDSSNNYSSSTVKEYLDNIINGEAGAGKPDFRNVADAIQTNTDAGGKLYLLSTAEAEALPVNVRKLDLTGSDWGEYGQWWLRSPGDNPDPTVDFVIGRNGKFSNNHWGTSVINAFGVRPAFRLDLSKVIFSSVNLSGGANATSGVGSASQKYFDYGSTPSAITSVTYTADNGYKFPENSNYYTTTSGIKVERKSDTEVTVSGAPTANANITVPDAKPVQTITADDVTATYGETEKSISASVVEPATGGGSITYAVKSGSGDYIGVDAAAGTLTIKKVPPTDGKAYVTVTAAETDTYAKTTADVAVTISPAELTITAKDQTYEYNGNIQGPGDTAYDDPAEIAKLIRTEGLQGSDRVTGITIDGQGKEIGEYPITPSSAVIGNATDNYSISYVDGKLNINPPTPEPVAGKMAPKAVKAKGKNKLVIRWCKEDGAQGYDIFFAKCGKNTKCTKIKTIEGNKKFSWTKKGLKTKTPYKAYVKAWVKKGGKKQYIAKTPTFHIYTANETKHYTNAKSITVKKAKVSLKAGKTYKIKAKINKYNENKKLMPACHTKQLRYMSSNEKIATVDGSGRIKACSAGTCTVYVYAANGVNKAIKVTVK